MTQYHLHIGIVLVDKHPGAEPGGAWPPPCPRASTAPPLLNVSTDGTLHLQSHISSGISWGFRIPGTDICNLCFSSWAWRSEASRSSRNRSVVSSPANSCVCAWGDVTPFTHPCKKQVTEQTQTAFI